MIHYNYSWSLIYVSPSFNFFFSAQPLVSRVNFSSCYLTNADLDGLKHGLARIWCGGSALAESIIFNKNKDIDTTTWDAFFQTFVDPASLVSFWPQNPPPPPNLSFLQELDLRDTNAIGVGLNSFVKKLHGLKCLKLTYSNNNKGYAIDVLNSLPVGCLQKFEGNCFDARCAEALFKHSSSLIEIKLDSFNGDAGLILCGWPEPVHNLTLNIGKLYKDCGTWVDPSGNGFTPGSLVMINDTNFGVKAMSSLSTCANGLKKLVLHGMYYWQILISVHVLAGCGLETFYMLSPASKSVESIAKNQRAIGVSNIEQFWVILSKSKTLRDIRVSDQFIGGYESDEVAMIGRFLKSNRSVQTIAFDSKNLVLKVTDVKVLRSAFYGNKKVTDMEFLSKARQLTLSEVNKKTTALLAVVKREKAHIKQLFKSHYSKHNRHWRDKPNKLKLVHVEQIRNAKRELNRIQRDSKKIGSLLQEIQNCILSNKKERTAIAEEKSKMRIERREGQLKQLAMKKKKIITNLVTKVNKAKRRGRQQKSAKKQIPRSTYYKSKKFWPTSYRPPRPSRNKASYYNFYNDPYCVRNHWCWYALNNDMVNDDNWGSFVDESDQQLAEDDHDAVAAWDAIFSQVDATSLDRHVDPWATVDSLINQCDSDLNTCISLEYLSALHEEASELGVDVVENLAKDLDEGAALTKKLESIGAMIECASDLIPCLVDSFLEEEFDFMDLCDSLDDVPEYNADDFVYDGVSDFDENQANFDEIVDADAAVAMYAGAGPRRDSSGPSFGRDRTAVLAGAQAKKARKNNKSMIAVRQKSNRRIEFGYKDLTIVQNLTETKTDKLNYMSFWPESIKQNWMEDSKIEQIKAVARSDLLDLPEVTKEANLYQLSEWSYGKSPNECIDVVLVSQCSLDRLKNFEAQLTCWGGKASIAIYLKHDENRSEAEIEILKTVQNVRRKCFDEKKSDAIRTLDVAITIVGGCSNDEPYPINYLRNVALLEARRQHLRFNHSLDNSAVLLVDIDFRPSIRLYEAVHSQQATKYVMKDQRVIVCAAFESTADSCARSIECLRNRIEVGKAEGFHLSHFPAGHGPTQFDRFWELSLTKCNELDSAEKFWDYTYEVDYEKLFEPYIIMASANVPLYDERFVGYGLNKVSHIASVAAKENTKFFVLPGVFLISTLR